MEWLIVLGMGKQRELAVKTLIDRKDVNILYVDTFNSKGYSVYFQNVLFLSSLDEEYVISKIKTRINGGKVRGLITFLEHLIPLTCQLAEYFNVQSIQNFENGRDKYLMREHLSKVDEVKQPLFMSIASKEQLENEYIKLEFPVVIKPIDMTASIGVRLLKDKEELKKYLSETPNYNGKGYLIEEYIDGQEYSAEGYIQFGRVENICITKKEVDNSNNLFIESGHLLPEEFPEEIEFYIERQIKRTLEALKLDSCVYHLEFKVKEGNFYFIEVAVRPGGDYIADLLYSARRINLYNIAIDIALGKQVLLKGFNKGFAAIKYVMKNKIEFDKIDKSKIINVSIPNKIKEININSNLDRQGFIQLRANSYKDLKEDLAKL